MRCMLVAAAISTALASTAFASHGASHTIVDDVDSILERAGFQVPVSSLTDQQIVEIYLAGTSPDSATERNKRIESILKAQSISATGLKKAKSKDWGLVVTGENSVETSVQNFLDRAGLDADASALSDDQVADIYFAAFGSDDDMTTHRTRVEWILGN